MMEKSTNKIHELIITHVFILFSAFAVQYIAVTGKLFNCTNQLSQLNMLLKV